MDPAASDLQACLPSSARRRYRPLRLLGSGGMGDVFLVHDGELGRDVALKVIRADAPGEAAALRRFRREVLALSRVSHPHVVRLYDFEDEGGEPWFTMEYVPGDSLKRWIDAGPVPVRTAVGWAVQVCEGLAAVHGAGVLHRDVKPSNVMVGPDGRAKLMDFGLVKAIAPVDETALTATGNAIGTLYYLPPEIMRGEAWTPQGDVYQVGVVLHEMLAGRHPFESRNLGAMILNIRDERLPPLAGTRDGIDAELDTTLRKACAGSVTARHDGPAPLAAELRAWLARRGDPSASASGFAVGPLPAAREEAAAEAPTVAAPPLAGSSPDGLTATDGRLPPRAWLPAAGLLLLLAAGLAMRLRAPEGPSTPTAGPPTAVRAAPAPPAAPPVPRAVLGRRLVQAVTVGDEAEAARLLAAGAPTGPVAAGERAPLAWAARLGRASLVELLLRAGAVVDARDGDGRTALHEAAFHGEATCTRLLLEHGAQAGVVDGNGGVPLVDAAAKRRLEVVRLLVGHGADPNARRPWGTTALHEAARKGYGDVVAVLLDAGADPSRVDYLGSTAAALARAEGHAEVAARIEERARSKR